MDEDELKWVKLCSVTIDEVGRDYIGPGAKGGSHRPARNRAEPRVAQSLRRMTNPNRTYPICMSNLRPSRLSFVGLSAQIDGSLAIGRAIDNRCKEIKATVAENRLLKSK